MVGRWKAAGRFVGCASLIVAYTPEQGRLDQATLEIRGNFKAWRCDATELGPIVFDEASRLACGASCPVLPPRFGRLGSNCPDVVLPVPGADTFKYMKCTCTEHNKRLSVLPVSQDVS